MGRPSMRVCESVSLFLVFDETTSERTIRLGQTKSGATCCHRMLGFAKRIILTCLAPRQCHNLSRGRSALVGCILREVLWVSRDRVDVLGKCLFIVLFPF